MKLTTMLAPLLGLCATATLAFGAGVAGGPPVSGATLEPGSEGGPGLALRARKALAVPFEGPQVIDNAVVLVRDGKIEAVGSEHTLEIPADYHVRDVGDRWLMPGMVDLHSHVGGTFDINDTVFLINPELRAYTSVIPDNPSLRRAIAGGVTTILFIPGSGSNSGGQGVLFKTAQGGYEDMLVRAPGSLKVAQWGNPERWAMGVGKTFENYNLRTMFARGAAYAKLWSEFEAGNGPEPEVDIQFELFRRLESGEVPVSVHTQVYQVVLETITMIKGEFGLNVFCDHSTIGGWAAAPLAEKMGVPAIVGPRQVDTPRGWVGALPTYDRIQGVAAGWQEGGQSMLGFNTDAPVMPQEELFLQSAMAVRYGLDDSKLTTVRGLTIIPAMVANIAERVGSLEPGKDADILVITGHPSDPRTSVEAVLVNGLVAYDAEQEQRRF